MLNSPSTPQLCPVQDQALRGLLQPLATWHVAAVSAPTGMGRTTVLRAAHERVGGAFLTMQSFVESMTGRHPLSIEETFHGWVLETLRSESAVFVDDLHVITDVVSAHSCRAYPRGGLLDAPLLALTAYAAGAGKKLVFGTDSRAPGPVDERCVYANVEEFKPADYQALCETFWRSAGHVPPPDSVDYDKVFRFAPKLTRTS